MQKIGDIPNTRADSNGEFTDGNVAGGVPPTILPAAWFNTIQRELMSVLSAAEIDADSAQFNQVLLSIQKLIGEGIPDIKDASLTQKGIVQLSNATNSTSEVLAATPKAVKAANDAALQKSANLSDLQSTSTARTNLGLGGAAVLNVGTTVGTVAAGDDPRITASLLKANNLSDLTNVPAALSNLGLSDAFTASEIAATPWVNLTLLNAWTTYPDLKCAYRKVLGLVFVEVNARNGTFSDGTILATLPVGYRPAKAVIAPVLGQSLANTLPARVSVNVDGAIVLIGFSSAATAGLLFNFSLQ